MKRPDGVTIVAIYHLFAGAFGLLGGCAILFFAVLPVIFSVQDAAGLFWALFGLGIALMATVGAGLIALLVAWGLLRLMPWARWAAIVLAAISLFAFPIGTIIGALIIWYLLQPEAQQAFGA